MKDIGCHFGFEYFEGNPYHKTNLFFSSGRNSLRYIIRERNIKVLYLPYFLCETVSEAAIKENVEIIYYHITDKFLPDVEPKRLDKNSYLYFVNYYGMLREQIPKMISIYKNVIVDNTHDFFNEIMYNADSIYNYRKYFGVPDGSCIVSPSLEKNNNYEIGKSLDKIFELVSRDETGEFFHYSSFEEADRYFKNESLCYMSNFTRSCINAINYELILWQRTQNFMTLDSRLQKYNKFKNLSSLTYMYPLLVDSGDLVRNYLGELGVYAIQLWPNVLYNQSNDYEKYLTSNVLLLPIDQRYNQETMNYIADNIENILVRAKR